MANATVSLSLKNDTTNGKGYTIESGKSNTDFIHFTDIPTDNDVKRLFYSMCKVLDSTNYDKLYNSIV
jgi:hypothetical protein